MIVGVSSVDLPHVLSGLAMSDANNTPSFEAKLAELEALVRQMEQGSMPLDTSLDAFEKGVQLAKECHTPRFSFAKSDRNQAIWRTSAV